jgi:hypothetical protein
VCVCECVCVCMCVLSPLHVCVCALTPARPLSSNYDVVSLRNGLDTMPLAPDSCASKSQGALFKHPNYSGLMANVSL